MATYVKTKRGWQAQVSRKVNGKSVRKAKNFKSKREAQLWAAETEASLTPEGASKEALENVFLRYGDERSRFKRGSRWEIIRLKRFAGQDAAGKPLGEYQIGEIETQHIVAWRDARLREVMPATVRREMNLLKHVFSTATNEWKLIDKNPMATVKSPPDSRRRKRRVYPHEIDALSEALDLDVFPWESEKQITGAAFLFAIETAMRVGEILGIQNRHVTGMVVHLPETKTDEPRDVPLSYRALEILKEVRGKRTKPTDRPFNIDAASRDSRFRLACKAAGITDLHFHDTRHEGITRLAKRLDILDLARTVGHNNLNQLLTYYEASPEELADRINSATSKDDSK